MKKTQVWLTDDEIARVRKIATAMVDKIICGETMRLALPIVRLMHEITTAKFKQIENKYGEVI